jgi:hypothetical protein
MAANGAMIKKKSTIIQQAQLSGSVLSLMTITAFEPIILLLKPVPDVTAGYGVDYSKGANFLLRTLYRSFRSTRPVYHHVIVSLTAFQFGSWDLCTVKHYVLFYLGSRRISCRQTIRMVTGV